ncbi:AAA family ATPase [Edaphobacter modestus]|uniref:AAA family ATPase n=1 Tax=Edaphobacter modestus TaxID=388466 RepID=UPI001A91894B|nr:AAA family ATPase [Edaphobacter modestus]
MNRHSPTLHFFCGRLAAGKTTLARQIADEQRAVFLSEDLWLSRLSDGIRTFDDYLKWSRRCRSVMAPLIIEILKPEPQLSLTSLEIRQENEPGCALSSKRQAPTISCTTSTSPKKPASSG